LIREVRILPATIRLQELSGLIGQEVGVGDWFDVAQARIDAFAEATLDRQWIHCDPDRARREPPYGTTIAHGFLTLALLSHLHSRAVTVAGPLHRIVNYGLNRVRFPSPVPAEARLRCRSSIHAVKEMVEWVQVTWKITVECQGQTKPVLVAEWLLRYYR
jgi:acyl dehydratase